MSHSAKYEMGESPPKSFSGSQENILNKKPENGHENQGFKGDSSHIELTPVGKEGNGGTKYEEFSPDLQDKDDEERDCCSNCVYKIQSGFANIYNTYNDSIWTAIYVLLSAAYFVYFIFAMRYSFGDEGSIRLLVVTILAVLFITWNIFSDHFGDRCCSPVKSMKNRYNAWSPAQKKKFAKYMHWLLIMFMIGYAIFAIVWVVVDVGLKTPENLISAVGMVFFVVTFYIFSVNPAKVQWRPVMWGLVIQFAFALLILRWDIGFQAFSWLGDRVQEFLLHTDAGAIFVFGDAYTNHFFAFKVLPVIVFFSTMMSVLYYLGVMQFIIRHIARGLAFALGTSPAESLNAAGNIFIGQSEAPLMIRPFLAMLTKSELHAVMTGGFATIAGSVMAAYISYGVPANHLIAASVMSAPAALAMSKLFYPETEETKATAETVYKMENTEHTNVIAAASEGASTSISLVANIAANLIAFIAILKFVNATLTWFGHRVGWYDPELTFELICSYVFWPIAFMMGIHTADCQRIAELIGVKTFLNEFVAYTRLAVYIGNRKTLYEYQANMTKLGLDPSWNQVGEDIFLPHVNRTLERGILTDRSEVITTYALCGFSNISSIGIMIGALGALAPSRKLDITQTVVRAMIAGNVACFMTACIAGLLYRETIVTLPTNSTM